jgi:hypothetical protein
MTHEDWTNQTVLTERGWVYRRRLAASCSELFQQRASEFDQELADPEKAFKHDRTTTVQEISRGAERFILKRYNARNVWHRFKRAFRRSRAVRCWDMSVLFCRAELKVAEPVCVLEKRFGPICRGAYLITRFLPGDELLELFPAMSLAEQQRVAKAVKSAFAQMKIYRLSHGDLKATNLLWVEGELFFIDLDAARWHRTDRTWERAHKKDLKRFLKNWQHHPQLMSLFADI